MNRKRIVMAIFVKMASMVEERDQILKLHKPISQSCVDLDEA